MAYPYSYDYEAQQKEKEYRPSKLQTDRNMWKLMILNILTLGIYGIIFFIPFAFDLDKISPQKRQQKTMNYLTAYILALFTFSIVITVWHYHIAERVEDALTERNIVYNFGTDDFWNWYVFGSLILLGPFLSFVYSHKLCRAMNLLCEDYNREKFGDAKS